MISERTAPHARLARTATTTGILISIATAISVWGDWTLVAITMALNTTAMFMNFALTAMKPRFGRDRVEAWRAIGNTIVHGTLGVVSGWTFAAWMFVPFITVIACMPPATYARGRVIGLLVAFNTLALTTGGTWQDALVFLSITVFLIAMVQAYLELANNLLRERDETLADLQTAQRIALAHEKLASIGQLAAGVAHEINNPMCFVSVNLEQLLDDLRSEPDLPASLVDYRDTILPETFAGVTRVTSIVADLRRFARGEPEQLGELDLSNEVESVLRIARTHVAPAQRLVGEIASGVTLVGMRRQMCQVVLNLVMNGIEAISATGQVTVRLAADPDSVTLSVSDNGKGMTPKTIENLFQPFFTTKAAGEGPGLGLAVVHGIVHAHGGQIAVESEPGKGSTLTLFLPRRRAITPQVLVRATTQAMRPAFALSQQVGVVR